MHELGGNERMLHRFCGVLAVLRHGWLARILSLFGLTVCTLVCLCIFILGHLDVAIVMQLDLVANVLR